MRIRLALSPITIRYKVGKSLIIEEPEKITETSFES
jgi:hypothetical protein